MVIIIIAAVFCIRNYGKKLSYTIVRPITKLTKALIKIQDDFDLNIMDEFEEKNESTEVHTLF